MGQTPNPSSWAEQRLARLHAFVLENPALQTALFEIADPRAFAEAVAEVARGAAMALQPGDLDGALRPDPAGLRRFGPPPATFASAPIGWLPVALRPTASEPLVEWLYFGRRRLTDPFFEGSSRSAAHMPFNRLFRFCTPLSGLTAPDGAPPLEPDGFIFHMSRCGSTLAAQMLAASPANIVISEAPPIDTVVQIARGMADEDAGAALLRAMVLAYGRRRRGDETRFIIKLDSWHTLAAPLFRRAFPDAPWAFLYREPEEVMVSQMRQRGIQMVPEFVPPSLYGLDLPGGVPDEDYCARVLGAVCDGAVRAYEAGGGVLVNYRQLPEAMETIILPAFGVALTGMERRAMAEAAGRDAKAPIAEFSSDTEAKRAEVTEAVRTACHLRVRAVYDRLEAMRVAPAEARLG